MSQVATVPSLKFSADHIDPILRGEKTATIRYNGPDLSVGYRVHLCDTNGERFATAVICDIGYNDIQSIVRFGVEGHRAYASPADMIHSFQDYYPDVELTPDTHLDIYYWEEMWE